MSRNSKLIMSGLVVITLILTMSCDPAIKYEKEEKEQIQQYLLQNNITVQPTASGLYYIEITEGTGDLPVVNDSVIINYTCSFLGGTVIDSSLTTKPYVFAIGTESVIPGFEEGITYMKKGGKAKLLLPSSLAYGPYGNYWGNIPGYTPLIFVVKLIDIKLPACKK